MMEHLTVCCRQGMLLLKRDEHKQIVLDSLAFLARTQRIWLYGFVILEDEIHVLWEIQPDWRTRNIRQILLKYTAQRIKHHMFYSRDPSLRRELDKYRSPRHDRYFHFWEHPAATAPVTDMLSAAEILEHMHEAPFTTGICLPGTTYPFSSSAFYHLGICSEEIITHYKNANHLT